MKDNGTFTHRYFQLIPRVEKSIVGIMFAFLLWAIQKLGKLLNLIIFSNIK